MKPIKVYRAFYIENGKKEYIRGGKFYKSIGLCKQGIRFCDWEVKDKRIYIIEEYDITWSADVCFATAIRDGYHVNVEYERVDYGGF